MKECIPYTPTLAEQFKKFYGVDPIHLEAWANRIMPTHCRWPKAWESETHRYQSLWGIWKDANTIEDILPKIKRARQSG